MAQAIADGGGATTSGGPAAAPDADNRSAVALSAMRKRTTDKSGMRARRSRSRHRLMSVRSAGWNIRGGSAAQSGSPRRIAASVSETSSPSNAFLPDQHFEQQTAERPDVAALIDRLALRLLRTHVGGGAENDAGLCARVGERRRGREIDGAARIAGFVTGQSEIEHLHLAIGGQRDVAGFEVAVNDPLLVRRFQRVDDLARNS